MEIFDLKIDQKVASVNFVNTTLQYNLTIIWALVVIVADQKSHFWTQRFEIPFLMDIIWF